MDHKENKLEVLQGILLKWESDICSSHPTSLCLPEHAIKETDPEYSSEGLMLKLTFQYFGHLMQTADSLEETLMLGKTEGERRGG